MESIQTKPVPQCVAFVGTRAIASGDIIAVATKAKQYMDEGNQDFILIFDTATSEPVEVDFRGSLDQVVSRISPAPAETPVNRLDTSLELESDGINRRPGRPKLGVIAREITLLPRHWEWLQKQPGGASVALRKLVEEARHQSNNGDKIRIAKEVTYKFMSAMAGNLPDFENATRALFTLDKEKFENLISNWPADLQSHVKLISQNVFLS